MTNIKSVIAELREHHRGITFYRRMSYGKDNGHGWQKIDLKHYLPQLLEYVEELERRLAQSEKLEHCSCCNQSKEEWVCLE